MSALRFIQGHRSKRIHLRVQGAAHQTACQTPLSAPHEVDAVEVLREDLCRRCAARVPLGALPYDDCGGVLPPADKNIWRGHKAPVEL